MTGSLADYAENKMLDRINGRADFTMPTPKVALFTSDPGEAGGGTEVTGGSYARASLTVAAASGGSQSNSADVAFPVATADWGTITHIAIFDAASGGNMLWHGSLATARTILSGDQLRIVAGSLTFSLD